MKKVLKSRIFLVIVTALVFSGITAVAATLISSNDVTYKNTTTKAAIDELYNKVSKMYTKAQYDAKTPTKIYTFSQSGPHENNGGATCSSSFTLNIKSMYPSTYQNYTSNNFIFVTTTVDTFGDDDNSDEMGGSLNISVSYNKSTGILTVSGLDVKDSDGLDEAEVAVIGGYVLLFG